MIKYLAAAALVATSTSALAGLIQPTPVFEFSDSGTYSFEVPYGGSGGFYISTPYAEFSFRAYWATVGAGNELMEITLDSNESSGALIPTPPFTHHSLHVNPGYDVRIPQIGDPTFEGELTAVRDERRGIGQTFEILQGVGVSVSLYMGQEAPGGTVSVNGTWNYSGGEYHWGTDPRPVTSVPDAGATLPLLGLGIVGLAATRLIYAYHANTAVRHAKNLLNWRISA